ncbi:MAG: response regulator transcription factor [Clostridiales bacterium]|jgi:DNA-binding response OmpR family regulator|nr:response regulator transcription factor [Clostridiales bacterium]
MSTAPKNPLKILLAEDDGIIAAGLSYAFETDGYAVTYSGTVKDALDEISRQSFDIAVLDLSLPDGSGFDIFKSLKSKQPLVPVIFLTAVDDEGNVVKGLEMGADDYITKPFRIRELSARLKAALRRANHQAPEVLSLGDVSIRTAQGKVFKNSTGTEILLSAQEYRLLLILAQNKGQVLSRSRLLEALWDCAGSFVNDNTLTVCMKRLREKLADGAVIETVRGLGYRAEG